MDRNMSPEALQLWVYGTYLLNGGTREGFMDMTDDDFEAMAVALLATSDREHKRLTETFVQVMSKMFGRTNV